VERVECVACVVRGGKLRVRAQVRAVSARSASVAKGSVYVQRRSDPKCARARVLVLEVLVR